MNDELVNEIQTNYIPDNDVDAKIFSTLKENGVSTRSNFKTVLAKKLLSVNLLMLSYPGRKKTLNG